jgi:hypothetical protein
MKNLILILSITAVFFSCKKEEKTENKSDNRKTTKNVQDTSYTNYETQAVDPIQEDLEEQRRVEDSLFNYKTYYVVIADISENYYALRKKAIDLKGKLNIPIDSLERCYNKEKHLIALPDNYDDEMYAGQYYPRRNEEGKFFSIEYLRVYDNGQSDYEDKTMVLVAGVFESEKSADSTLIVVKKYEKNTMKLKSNIYVGCMH